MNRYLKVLSSMAFIVALAMGLSSCGDTDAKRESAQSQEALSSQVASETNELEPLSTPNFAELIEMDGASLEQALEGSPMREGPNMRAYTNNEAFFEGEDTSAVNPDRLAVGDWFVVLNYCDGAIVSPSDFSHASDERRAEYMALGFDYWTDLFLVGPRDISADKLASLIDTVFPIKTGGIAIMQDGSIDMECSASTSGVFLSNRYEDMGAYRIYHLMLLDRESASRFFHGEVAGSRPGKSFFSDFDFWGWLMKQRTDAGEQIDLYYR